MTRLIIIFAACLAFAACGDKMHASSASQPRSDHAKVVRVVDGDTIKVDVGGEQKSVRLIGIDTPETHKPGVKVECGGKEASANMARLAPAGAEATLVYDRTQDKVDRYGRLLAYVSVRGKSLQLEQLYAGNAEVYVYGGHAFKRVDSFRHAENVAKQAHRGVWGACAGDFHSEQDTARSSWGDLYARSSWGKDV